MSQRAGIAPGFSQITAGFTGQPDNLRPCLFGLDFNGCVWLKIMPAQPWLRMSAQTNEYSEVGP